MKTVISVENLKHSLKLMCTALNGRCEYFPFFGSLLGLVRDKGPIPGDDDIDFYINKKHFPFIISIIKDFGFELNSAVPNHTKHFLQVQGLHADKEFRIDFYFYDDEADPYYIEERWNFKGDPSDIKTVLRTPKPLIFPLKTIFYENTLISMPQNPEILCEFLYGINWQTPQQKDIDYQTITLGGRPIRFVKNGNNMTLLP